jgi:squalene-associated FAD-dependent desaturase
MAAPDVIVVGAGFAGLSAAVRLARRGARVLVVEERRRLGGRASAFADPETGEVVDNGQHALFGCYHETFAFLRDIGAEGDVRLEERLDLEIVDRRGQRSRLTSMSLPPPLHLVGGLLRWPALTWSDKVAALRAGLALRRLAASDRDRADNDRRTVNEWLHAHGQTPRLSEVLWEPLAVAALNQSPDVAAAGPFVEVLARMFNGSRRDAAIGLPVKPLDQLYAEPARRWLEDGGHQLRIGAPARLLVDGARAVGVEIDGERMVAGHVVSSVPWFAFPAFAASVPALADLSTSAGAMRASPIVTVNLWLDRAVTDAPFVGLPGRTFQWVFDKGRLFGEAWSHLSLTSSGAEDIVGWTNDALIAHARRELAEALPAAASAIVRRSTAVRERRATFSLAPGQPPRPGVETPVQGLCLAGDWTDTGLPATIEGAVASGHRAAELAASRR